jgi:manganese transport protein
MAGQERNEDIRRYPLADAIPQEQLDAELAELEEIEGKPMVPRLLGYLKLGGPGFIGAGFTLGAGSVVSAMISGVIYGYKTMWVTWFSMAVGLFMIAAVLRIGTKAGQLVALQNKHHHFLVGSILTALGGVALPVAIWSWGQFALAGNLLENFTPYLGFKFPRQYNWTVIWLLTTYMTLMYGRKDSKGTKIVENFMKLAIGLMVVGFAFSVVKVGVNWPEFFKGNLIPWIPKGGDGLDLVLASGAAACGVVDWFLFHYTGLSRGWSSRHEKLGRMDMFFGLGFPFIIVNWMVITVFAQTLGASGAPVPEDAVQLAHAFTPLLGSQFGSIFFYLAFLAVPITSIVGLNIVCAIGIFEAFRWKPDVSSLRWKICALIPSTGFLAVWTSRPLWLVIFVTAFISLTNNFAAWSIFMLVNDKAVMKADRVKNYFWNLGIMLAICFVNAAAIVYVFNRFGVFG